MKLPQRFGRYLLEERIGGGGMATVYRATFSVEGGFEKEVALKVIRGELSEDPQFIHMFLDEARLSGSLSHPNIVQTFDFGQVEGIYYLAMELVRGRTLAAILETLRENRLRLGTAASLFVAKELARALDYAHRAVGPDGESLGIVHRDVSPQNVLVSREGHVKLADFGIAKAALRSQITQPGRVRGKCSYMAPEQARGLEVDARADVFALGAVLWECLVGRRLFDGSTDAVVLLDVIEKEIPPPSRFVRGIPPEVDRAVLRLLERDLDRRPSSAVAYRELADLAFRLARSPEDLDLLHLQQKLASATAAVSRPEIELSTWKTSSENAYPWPVDPDAETIVSDEEVALRPLPSVEDHTTRTFASGEGETLTLGRTRTGARTAESESSRRGKALVPAAIASAVGAALGIAAVFVWKPWEAREEFGSELSINRDIAEAPSESVEAIPLAVDDRKHVSNFQPAGPEMEPPAAPSTEPKAERPAAGVSNSLGSARMTHVENARRVSTRAEAPAPASEGSGTLVVTSRLAGAKVAIDGGDAKVLPAMSPSLSSVRSGRRSLDFRHDDSDFSCRVSVDVGADERVAILFDRDGVFALRGLERQPIPCR